MTSPVLDTSKTLRPGLLVALKTSIAGNVKYRKAVLEAEEIDTNGTLTAKWETAKTVVDAAEQEAAAQARNKARNVVAGVCAVTAFGYLCPESSEDKLKGALREANRIVEAFNDTAKLTRVYFYAITGRVAPDDVEAVKAINAEVRTLLAEMEKGVATCDVKVIRKAATEAKQLGEMLSADAQGRITYAIEAARTAARQIVKAGEAAAVEVDRATIAKLTECRTAFLDLDETGPVATPFQEGRAVDLGVSEATPRSVEAAPRTLDM